MIRHIMRSVLTVFAVVIFILIGVNFLSDDEPKETMNLSTHASYMKTKDKIPSKFDHIDLYTKDEQSQTYNFHTVLPVTNSDTINSNIEEWIETKKQTFLASLSDDVDTKASLQIDVAIERESEHYHRFVFKLNETNHDGEENETKKVFNVDLETETVLSLNHFLDTNDQTLQAFLEQGIKSLEEDTGIAIDDNTKQHILTSHDTWEWFIDQDGLTFIFDSHVFPDEFDSPMSAHIPLPALYLHMQDDINQYVKLSNAQQKEMKTAIEEEKERILAAKQEAEKREQEKAEAKRKQEEAATNSGGKYVALTFDDGPSADVTPRVLETLKQYDAKATFFMLGSQVDYHPDMAKRVSDAGHEIGNHTKQHQDLTTLGPEEIRQEISSTSDTIANATGTRPYLVRPPYGAYNDYVINDAANHGDSIVLWSVDSLDWQSRNANAINHEIQQQITPGSIVLMHDIHEATADALPELMEQLHQEGYQFVTVSQLLEMQGQNGAGPYYGIAK